MMMQTQRKILTRQRGSGEQNPESYLKKQDFYSVRDRAQESLE